MNKEQRRSEIHYEIFCKVCENERCGWSPVKDFCDLDAICLECKKKRDLVEGRKTKKQFKAAQIEMPIKIQAKQL